MINLNVAVLVSLSCGLAGATSCQSNPAAAKPDTDPATVFLQIDSQLSNLAAELVGPRAQPLAPQFAQFTGGRVLHNVSEMRVGESNLVFVRIPKTASTSGCGVTRRIAAHHGLNGVFDRRAWPDKTAVLDPKLVTWVPEPVVFAEHGSLDSEHFSDRPAADFLEAAVYPDRLPSMAAIRALELPTFLWTVVRDPAGRAMSNLYYSYRGRGNPNTATKVAYLQNMNPNVMFRYIRPSAEATPDDIFSTYGLVGVLERFDESLVVLAATLKVPLSDMLYLPSKEDGCKNEQNLTITKHLRIDEEPQVIQDMLNSKFRPENQLDYQLLDRANQTLSSKIAQMKLGPAINTFKDLLARAQKDCDVPGQEKDPIASLTKCYYSDNGCNYECFDKYEAESRASCTWCD